MGNFSGKFTSTKQEWETPEILFTPLNAEFNFELDLAADDNNNKCSLYYTEQDNGLVQSWKGICWLNPPFGNKYGTIKDWVKKSFEETQESGVVVILIPARTNTKWWYNYCMKAKEIRFVIGRPKFGESKYGLPQPLAIVVFTKHDGKTQYSEMVI